MRVHNLAMNEPHNPVAPRLLLEAVCKSYNEGENSLAVLKRLQLRAESGEFLAIGGPSGSGKSTLLNIIGGIDTPDSGKICINGLRIDNLSESRRTLFRRQHIGIVFQFFNLIPTLTVGENLRLPLALCGKNDDDGSVEQWLERFDLISRMNDYPDTLSGGEQQRVAVIRAAIHSPDLVIADEPTGNLDQQRSHEVVRLLRELADSGICVIMATHSATAASAADRQLILRQGTLPL